MWTTLPISVRNISIVLSSNATFNCFVFLFNFLLIVFWPKITGFCISIFFIKLCSSDLLHVLFSGLCLFNISNTRSEKKKKEVWKIFRFSTHLKNREKSVKNIQVQQPSLARPVLSDLQKAHRFLSTVLPIVRLESHNYGNSVKEPVFHKTLNTVSQFHV